MESSGGLEHMRREQKKRVRPRTCWREGTWAGEGRGEVRVLPGADRRIVLTLGGASSVTQSTKQRTGNHPVAEMMFDELI